MAELKKLEIKSDVKETLEGLLEKADEIECIMVIGIRKEGTQMMVNSTCSGYQKTFMVSFAQAWMSNWFFEED